MSSLYKLFSSKGQMFAFILGLVVVLLILGSVITGLSGAGYDMSTDLNQVLKNSETEEFNFFNLLVTLPVILIGLALVFAVVFSVIQLFSDPKGSMKAIIGLGIVVVLFAVFYSMASPETAGRIGMLHDKFGITDGASKLISGGIKTTLTLVGAAAILMVISEIRNMFK